jgi:hypothetical protein
MSEHTIGRRLPGDGRAPGAATSERRTTATTPTQQPVRGVDPPRVRPTTTLRPPRQDRDAATPIGYPVINLANQSAATPDVGGRADMPPVLGLPLPALLNTSRQQSVYCLVTPVGRDGRLANRSVIRHMSWSASQTLMLNVEPGPIVAVRPGEGIRIGHRYQLRLPLTIRRQCTIVTGDQLLVVAHRQHNELLVMPVPVVADLIAAARASQKHAAQ